MQKFKRLLMKNKNFQGMVEKNGRQAIIFHKKMLRKFVCWGSLQMMQCQVG